MLQRSPRAGSLTGPCLPSPANAPPSGPDWLHEIKHGGDLGLARRDAKGVRLYTRNGHDFADRYDGLIWVRWLHCLTASYRLPDVASYQLPDVASYQLPDAASYQLLGAALLDAASYQLPDDAWEQLPLRKSGARKVLRLK